MPPKRNVKVAPEEVALEEHVKKAPVKRGKKADKNEVNNVGESTKRNKVDTKVNGDEAPENVKEAVVEPVKKAPAKRGKRAAKNEVDIVEESTKKIKLDVKVNNVNSIEEPAVVLVPVKKVVPKRDKKVGKEVDLESDSTNKDAPEKKARGNKKSSASVDEIVDTIPNGNSSSPPKPAKRRAAYLKVLAHLDENSEVESDETEKKATKKRVPPKKTTPKKRNYTKKAVTDLKLTVVDSITDAEDIVKGRKSPKKRVTVKKTTPKKRTAKKMSIEDTVSNSDEPVVESKPTPLTNDLATTSSPLSSKDETDIPKQPIITVEVDEKHVKKTAAKKRVGKKGAAVELTRDEDLDGEVPTVPVTKRKVPVKNANSTDAVANVTISNASPKIDDIGNQKPYTLKLTSWNVAGLRALVKKNGLNFLEEHKPDIFCMQEIKCLSDEVPAEAKLKGYHYYWNSVPGGHAGVAIYTRVMPYNVEYGLGDKDLDGEGRLITAEYSKFFLVCVYVPNSGRKLVTLPKRMRWNKLFMEHLEKLNAIKPVIVCGDMNVSHLEIDLANPKANKRNAGFTDEERDDMTKLLSAGFVDTFRMLYPDQLNAYTFWTYMGNARARNIGWRLDYFLVSERIQNKVVDNVIQSKVMGSDHCPITLYLHF